MSLIRLSQQLFKPFKTSISAWMVTNGFLKPLAIDASQNQPILSAEEIRLLADDLAQLTNRIMPNLTPSEAQLQGEQSSFFTGAGLEYEESRPYEMGDEIRRINWRLMAKTGKAYTKLFQEERQENWLIIVDHRASMRFGTRKRLKATQATRIAGYFAWLAQKASIPVVGARLTDKLDKTPLFEGRGAYSHLMEKFSEPCPPLTLQANQHEPHLNDVLLGLLPQIQPGSRLILISDFHDINDKTTEILAALQPVAMVKAICIQDPSELKLPEIEGLQLESLNTPQTFTIDSIAQRNAYQAWSKNYHQHLQSYLQKAGIEPIIMRTDEPLSAFSCFKPASSTKQENSGAS